MIKDLERLARKRNCPFFNVKFKVGKKVKIRTIT